MFIRFEQQLLTISKNLLLFSMSFADFCVGVTGSTTGLIFLFAKKGSITETLYKIGGMIPLFGSFFVSVLSLAIMTADRLVSVKFPLRYRLMVTRKRIKLGIFMCWLITLVFMTIQILLFFCLSYETELKVRCLHVVIFFVVGSTVLSISNTTLYRTVQRRTAKSNVGVICAQLSGDLTLRFESIERKQFDKTKQKEETAKARICIWMTVLFIVCWLPIAIRYALRLFLSSDDLGRPWLTVCLAFVGLNSVLNPVIYLLLRKDFQYYFQKMMHIKSS